MPPNELTAKEHGPNHVGCRLCAMVDWYTCPTCGADFDKVYKGDHEKDSCVDSVDYMEGMYHLATGDEIGTEV